MKGLAERTIVLIVIALLVLGIVSTLIYLGVGPFRESVNYNACKGQAMKYCVAHKDDQNICEQWDDEVPCANDVKPIINCEQFCNQLLGTTRD